MTTVSSISAFHVDAASLNVSQLLELTGGELKPLVDRKNQLLSPSRQDDLVFTGAAPPLEAVRGDITMIDQAKNSAAAQASDATVLLTPVALTAENLQGKGPAWQIVVEDPHAAFTAVIWHFRPPMDSDVPGAGVHSTAQIHPSAQISSAASIGAAVTIGPGCKIHAGVSIAAGCTVGANCTLFPNVTMYSYCRIGDRVVIHAGSVIGAHGFGYRQEGGRHVPTSQLGYVEIENDVEIGASVTIDRGTYGATLIGEGTKIDNQVMIAHNCRIGRHNLLCSQVGIAGSCSTGDYVILAGQVGLKDHVHLADGAIVAAQSGVMEDLSAGVYLGSPATSQREQMQIIAVQRRLPELRREVKRLNRQVEELTAQLQPGSSSASANESVKATRDGDASSQSCKAA
ncbi:UDP-3-O-(3-hydroxymyristoyl)glucosamine N-acyltransferase [Neorhodopirellula pilleata]|uniref:UDP-3-O-acylglucosamine N-acyltransferase n=1 Tax=Neorhodopirellula pilleata TaxID=2714738 RepID=A0A5C6AV47_9BACT|nr:UDP-3-O-(3-hydroxymyristoyl)glucosamine N-acyltransferase [Neorhodopirellula pilleata]TWU01994.1 UDP-3-O-acylglucosamine N-acyltransferase [Neorhodopirellula pilleata]